MKMAPVKPQDLDTRHRCATFALQVKSSRMLFRNLHAPADSDLNRQDFFRAISASTNSRYDIWAGDFNSRPEAPDRRSTLMPPVPTFRRNVAKEEWCTCIDGIMIPNKAVLFTMVNTHRFRKSG